MKYAIFKYVLFNVNSSEYLIKTTNNYHEEAIANFSVIVAHFFNWKMYVYL